MKKENAILRAKDHGFLLMYEVNKNEFILFEPNDRLLRGYDNCGRKVLNLHDNNWFVVQKFVKRHIKELDECMENIKQSTDNDAKERLTRLAQHLRFVIIGIGSMYSSEIKGR